MGPTTPEAGITLLGLNVGHDWTETLRSYGQGPLSRTRHVGGNGLCKSELGTQLPLRAKAHDRPEQV